MNVKGWNPRIIVASLLAAILVSFAWQAYQQYQETAGAWERLGRHLAAVEAIAASVQREPQADPLTAADAVLAEAAPALREARFLLAKARFFDPVLQVLARVPGMDNNAQTVLRALDAVDALVHAGDEARLAAEATLAVVGRSGRGLDGPTLLEAAMAARPFIGRAVGDIQRAARALEVADADNVEPQLRSAIVRARSRLSQIAQVADLADDGIGTLIDVLGGEGERTYLILLQDSGELRPTGGFIGNVGVVKVAQGRVVEQKFGDVYDLDWPYYRSGKASPPVAMFARYLPEATFWGLRDANTSPDFPTSARQAIDLALAEGAADRIDGVIAITPGFAARVLKAMGPVRVPGFEEIVTAANFDQLIRHYQYTGLPQAVRERLGVKGQPSRKLFTSLLMEQMMERLLTADMATAVGVLRAAQEAIREKDLLVYLAEPDSQRFIERSGAAGEMKSAHSDYLWIVDMNLSVAKDNIYVRQSAAYSVVLEGPGKATGELTLTYDYRQTGELYLFTIRKGYYADFLRVYVPPGSVLLGSSGTDEPVETTGEGGKTVFQTLLKVYPGTVRTVTLRYSIPLNVLRAGASYRYELLMQKQPATDISEVTVGIQLPDDARPVTAQRLEADGQVLRYRGGLATDLALAVEFE